MEQDKKRYNILTTIVALLILAYPIIVILRMLSNIPQVSIATNAFNEVRDYVSFRLTHFILEGENPYTVEILGKTNVPFLLLYTGLNPLIVAIFCKITGLGVTAGYYIVNILLVAFTAINVWIIVKDCFSSHKIIAAICTIINTTTFFALFGLPLFNFHTDSIGIYLTSIILVTVYKNKKRTFLLAAISVFLIFTKQILVVMAVPLFIYYLITDRKLARNYFFYGLFCGLTTFAVIQYLFPLYWTENIYAQFFVSSSYGNIKHSVLNIFMFYFRYSAFAILFIFSIVGSKYYRSENSRFSLSSYSNRLIKDSGYELYLVLNMILGTAFLLYFAKCCGDGYKYCQDLLGPSLFILAVHVWYKYSIREESNKFSCRLIKNETFFVLLLCLATTITFVHFDKINYSEEDVKNFVELDSIIDSHKEEKIYLGINSTQYMLNRDIWESDDIWFNDGQIEYFISEYPDSSFINKFFYNEEIEKAAKEYAAEVNAMVQEKEFGLITTCIDYVINQSILEQNYLKIDTIKIKTDTNGPVDVSVWIPK